ncbi:hypothetical protein BaRGS_00000972 [Batillaria attramentaria]|uniref:Uncharacterized protein n=1 Tax=Batillaria attramentaria TaxID=370345 RepID=A0ABD0M8G0_9CAEN
MAVIIVLSGCKLDEMACIRLLDTPTGTEVGWYSNLAGRPLELFRRRLATGIDPWNGVGTKSRFSMQVYGTSVSVQL